MLYTFSNNSFWLIGVQVLDGVGAGIFGALTPLVIADIMRGTGRYNLAQGAIATMAGHRRVAQRAATGEIVDHFGYSAAFLALGAVAVAAVTVFAIAMPETADTKAERIMRETSADSPTTADRRRLNVRKGSNSSPPITRRSGSQVFRFERASRRAAVPAANRAERGERPESGFTSDGR